MILTLDQYIQKCNLLGITRIQTCQVSVKFTDISKMKYADRKAQTPIMCSFMHFVQGMLKCIIGDSIPIYHHVCFSFSLTDNTVRNLLSEVMWTRQGQRFCPLYKLAIVHKCLYNMYALLFLVSVLFDD